MKMAPEEFDEDNGGWAAYEDINPEFLDLLAAEPLDPGAPDEFDDGAP